jgi:hypothetical protein
MDLKDLKSAWDTYSSQEADKHHLGKEAIYELLRNRTKTMIDRIDRNIRIGMALILVFIAYVIIDDVYLSKLIIAEPIHYPEWLIPMDVFLNVIIVTTYLFFILRYIRIKRSFLPDTQLKDFLAGIIDTLATYRRLFYLAVAILLINMVVSFAAGLYQGVKFKADLANGGIENLPFSKILIIIGVGLAFLIPLVAVTFYVLRWGFNKLYGRYLVSLNEMMKELEEES